eukprot:gene9663-10650_t
MSSNGEYYRFLNEQCTFTLPLEKPGRIAKSSIRRYCKRLKQPRQLVINSFLCLAVCENNPIHEQEILELLVELTILNGELVTGKGGVFKDFCEKLDAALKEREADVDLRQKISYENSSYPKIDFEETDLNLVDAITAAENKVFKLIAECEKATGRADQTIAEVKQPVPR